MPSVNDLAEISKAARLVDVPRAGLERLLRDVIDTYRDCIQYDYPPPIAITESIREVLNNWLPEAWR